MKAIQKCQSQVSIELPGPSGFGFPPVLLAGFRSADLPKCAVFATLAVWFQVLGTRIPVVCLPLVLEVADTVICLSRYRSLFCSQFLAMSVSGSRNTHSGSHQGLRFYSGLILCGMSR